MEKIVVEWMHYDKEGETCTRCNSTGGNIQEAMKAISSKNKYQEVQIIFKETKLEADRMSDSNTVLINGKKLEDILDASASENFCHSCTCLSGKGTNCRTVVYGGDSYEAIPYELIEKAVETILSRQNIVKSSQ